MQFSFLLRRRLRFFVKAAILVSVIYITYQFVVYFRLMKYMRGRPDFPLGTHYYQKHFYKPDANQQFTCVTSQEKIDFSLVNDDYCDCLDGSDEPGSNACPNGQFFCRSQEAVPGFHKILPSSRVNDGICDCCDGSDEWLEKRLTFALPIKVQKRLNRYFSPCPNLCP